MRSMPEAELRVPPHSLHAEQSLLGGLMLDNSSWDRIADQVAERDLYRREHRLIFRAIAKLAEDDQPFDVVTLAETLERTEQLDPAGGLAYLGTLVSETPSAANIRAYAKIVRDTSILRRVIAVAADMTDSAFGRGAEASQILDSAQQTLADAADTGTGGWVSIGDAVRESLEALDARQARGGGIDGFATGLVGLDNILGGTPRGSLTVIGARPSIGKSALESNIARHNAQLGHEAAVFSLEMPRRAIADRTLCDLGGVDGERFRAGSLSDDEWVSLTAATKRVGSLPIFIDDRSSPTIRDLRARLRRLKREHPDLGLVFVDYLQLAKGQGENRTRQLTEIAYGLAGLAKDLDVAVYAAAQLNRSADTGKPGLGTLRESGDIEAAADQVILLWRPNEKLPDVVEAVVAKNRHGKIGNVTLAFIGKHFRFVDYAEPQYEPLRGLYD